MACEIITNVVTVADFLVYPTTCFYNFWLVILGTIMLVVAWGIFKVEQSRDKGDFIGSLAVSSIAFTIIASIGTLIKNSSDIPMIQGDILLYFLAFTFVMAMIWYFKD